VDKPRAQHPMVDVSRCIGCGSCVKACPEGGVLGLINGKAAIINGLRCVGHGLCADACPVEAVVIGMGDVSQRDDLPQLDGHYESNVPGVFIVGELGGLALIKNAIMQGTLAARAIASQLEARDPLPDTWDLLVVGAGPAGMATALEAHRLGLKPLLLDSKEPGGTILHYPRKKLVLTRPIEIPTYGWLTNPEYPKEQLLEIWSQALGSAQLEIRSNARVSDVQAAGDLLKVSAGDQQFLARRVVLAMGRGGTPRKLGVPGEGLEKVFYQLLDASQFQGDAVLVVGGGDSAVEAAISLGSQGGNTVHLSYRNPKFIRIKRRNAKHLEEAVALGQVTLLTPSKLQSITPDEVVLETSEGSKCLRNDYVFVFAGGVPPFDLLKKVGISFGGVEVTT